MRELPQWKGQKLIKNPLEDFYQIVDEEGLFASFKSKEAAEFFLSKVEEENKPRWVDGFYVCKV